MELAAQHQPIKAVHVSGRAMMQMLDHCKEDAWAVGVVCGIDVAHVMEADASFRLPTDLDLEEETAYLSSLMEHYGAVEGINDVVGRYCLAFPDRYASEESYAAYWNRLIALQFRDQQRDHRHLLFLCDPNCTSGSASIRAFRLTESFMALYDSKKSRVSAKVPTMTRADFAKRGILSREMLEEVPVCVMNTAAEHGLLYAIKGDDAAVASDHVPADPEALREAMERLSDCLDEYVQEQNAYLYHSRKGKQEKKGSSQSGVSAHLLSNQIRDLADQVSSLADVNMAKAFALQSLGAHE